LIASPAGDHHRRMAVRADKQIRARFEKAAEEHLYGLLREGSHVVVRPVTPARWHREAEGLMKIGFDRERVATDRAFSAEERAQLRGLNRLYASGGKPLEHRLLLFRGREIIGCYWGRQEENGRYYMVYSVVHPELQGQGLYGALLKKIVAAVRASGGFREIYSRHHADNNAILVPKLKQGFVIGAFEVSPRYGLLVHLRLYLNDTMTALHRYRIDASTNGAALRKKKIVRDG
jgi:GNAT superfamily N-acetyltransferase